VILSFAGRSDDAVAEAKRARKLDTNSFFAVWGEVNSMAFGGREAEVVACIPALLPRYGRHPWLMMALTAAYDSLGRAEEAEAVFLELNARSRFEYVQPTVLAATADYAGHRAEALVILRRAVEIRDPVLGAFARYSPPMRKLRTAPEFRSILAGLSRQTPAHATV
jgi:hypothetical protein